jgi:hypothetical protein
VEVVVVVEVADAAVAAGFLAVVAEFLAAAVAEVIAAAAVVAIAVDTVAGIAEAQQAAPLRCRDHRVVRHP